ncbi:hypothetical protein [Rhizobium sp. 28DA2]|uniref:hypothetical protein n=1 Tax=Rhizobium sp. 28DA2 TaxID=3035209 RepID=UPI0034E8573B
MSGDGSRWTVAGGFTVGHYGNGSLSIADGGYLQNGNGFIGTFQGSLGRGFGLRSFAIRIAFNVGQYGTIISGR